MRTPTDISPAPSGRKRIALRIESKGMPPKAKGRAKAKPKPRARRERTIYDDLPKDLRSTAKDMDRIEAIRGPDKLLSALSGINNALVNLSAYT